VRYRLAEPEDAPVAEPASVCEHERVPIASEEPAADPVRA
jgi:hypothetical protein